MEISNLTNITVSVPGKIILSGEHAVVYGKPAIAAAVDKRLVVTLTGRSDGAQAVNTDAEDDSLVHEAIRIAQEELKLGETTVDRHLFHAKTGWELDIRSDIPTGTGMGSSAAIAVGVVAAFVVASTKDARLDYRKINDLAYKVEKIQHGSPSGIDNSTVTFGGLVWYRKEFEFLKTFWKLQFKIAEDLINNFYVVNTGRPKETTGEMVRQVRERFCKKRGRIGTKFLQILGNIESVTKQIALGIKGEDEGILTKAMRKNERLLEELGTVGEFAQRVIKDIETSGGVAKISGAGGVKDRSGLLFIYHKDKDAVKEIAKKHRLTYFPAKLGVEGVKMDRMII